MCEGIETELDGINLGDQRLNQRSKKLLKTLASDPQSSINAACEGWADTLAAYRFFDNPKVTPEKLMQPHRAATVSRSGLESVVLVVQDTTELDYTAHPPHDAGNLDRVDRFGLLDHTLLAVTPAGLCLGVVGGEQFDRTPESLGKTAERSTLPIEEKESFRWLAGYREACLLAEECPATQIVSVGDREADLYDIFVEAERQDAGKRADFIVRARLPRCLTERVPKRARPLIASCATR